MNDYRDTWQDSLAGNDAMNGYLFETSPVNGGLLDSQAWRGIGSKAFNAGQVAKEDWMRDEQSANNAMLRNLLIQNDAQAFNASEAEKNRNWEKMMSDTSYQRMVADLKEAGLNPVLAYSNGGASSPVGSAGSSATGSAGSSSSKARHQQEAHLMSDIMSLAGGLVSSASKYEAAKYQADKKADGDYLKVGAEVFKAILHFLK